MTVDQEVASALHEALDPEYAARTLAMVAQGRWAYELDPQNDGAVGFYDRALGAYVAVLYLNGHPLGVDIEVDDRFEDLLAADR